MKFYMFRTVPLSIIRRFPLYTQQWHMSYRFADSLWAGSGWNSILILLASCQQTCKTYIIAVCTVENSWWWTEELSETCRISFQNCVVSRYGVFSNFLLLFLSYNKPTRCTNFSNLFWNKILHVSYSSSVHHQEISTVNTPIVHVI